jgi:hypothetical protein
MAAGLARRKRLACKKAARIRFEKRKKRTVETVRFDQPAD